MAAVSGGFRRWLLQQGGELLDTLSCRWGARLVWLAGQAGAPHAATIAQRVCALSRRVAPHIPVLRRNQAGSATICLMPHIRSRLLGRARRRYGADQHHQPRHTACATLLLLRVPSAATAVCSACSAFAAAVALLVLCLSIVCVTVCLLLSVRVCLREPLQSVHVCLSEILCQGVSFTLLLSAPRIASSRHRACNSRSAETLKRSSMLRRATEQPQQQLPGSCPPVPASAQHPMQPSSSSLPQAH